MEGLNLRRVGLWWALGLRMPGWGWGWLKRKVTLPRLLVLMLVVLRRRRRQAGTSFQTRLAREATAVKAVAAEVLVEGPRPYRTPPTLTLARTRRLGRLETWRELLGPGAPMSRTADDREKERGRRHWCAGGGRPSRGRRSAAA